TLSAQPIDIGLTAADSVIPLGDDLFRGMITLLTLQQDPIGDGARKRETGDRLSFSKPRTFKSGTFRSTTQLIRDWPDLIVDGLYTDRTTDGQISPRHVTANPPVPNVIADRIAGDIPSR